MIDPVVAKTANSHTYVYIQEIRGRKSGEYIRPLSLSGEL